MTHLRKPALLQSLGAMLLLVAIPARADIVVSQLIVELQPNKQTREDVEVWNNSSDRSFVIIEPRELVNASLPTQSVHRDPDPQKLGLLVTPARMILEPGQRKLVRFANLSETADRERDYRVTIKPVVGGIQSQDSGLKVLVGYDILVLVRPAQARVAVAGVRKKGSLTFTNSGNVSVELIDGQQCMEVSARCARLPSKRLYPGAEWTVELPSDRPAQYTIKSPGREDHKTF